MTNPSSHEPARASDASPARASDASPVRASDASPVRASDASPVRASDASPVRASDGERQAVADRLNAAVGEGRLTLSEFTERVGAAYAARDQGELAALVRDLPAGRSVLSAPAPEPVAAPLEIMVGAIKKRGRWRIQPSTALGVAIGPMKLDLRDADLAAHEVTLSARTVVGAIKVWVPRGVRVIVEGRTAVGTRTIAESNLPPEVDVPTLRLRLDTGVGTVKVYRT